MFTLFIAEYPKNHISQACKVRIWNKFQEHGRVNDLPRSDRPQNLNEDRKLYIVLSLQEDPNLPTFSVGQNHAMSRSTIRRFLKTEKYNSIKLYLFRKILETDYDIHLKFCVEMMKRYNENNGLKQIVGTIFVCGVRRPSLYIWSSYAVSTETKYIDRYHKQNNIRLIVFGENLYN